MNIQEHEEQDCLGKLWERYYAAYLGGECTQCLDPLMLILKRTLIEDWLGFLNTERQRS